MKTNIHNSLMQEKLHEYNTQLHIAIKTRNLFNVKNAILTGAPHKFLTPQIEQKQVIHQLIYNDFSIVAFLGYSEIVEHFMTKHSYANNHIYGATLQAIINGKPSVVELLLSQFDEKDIDINTKWGMLLSNSIGEHKSKNNTNNDLAIVKLLIQHGANLSACATHPLHKAVMNSNIETMTYLMDYQRQCSPSHKDYLPADKLDKLYQGLLRTAVKRNNPQVIELVKCYAKDYINDPTAIDYIILQKKLKENHQDIIEFASSLYNEDSNFLIKAKSLGKNHERFKHFFSLLLLQDKLNTTLVVKPSLKKNNKI